MFTEDSDFGGNVVVFYIAVKEYADSLSGRQMVLMTSNIDKGVNTFT
jgi:hypothetical protein